MIPGRSHEGCVLATCMYDGPCLRTGSVLIEAHWMIYIGEFAFVAPLRELSIVRIARIGGKRSFISGPY